MCCEAVAPKSGCAGSVQPLPFGGCVGDLSWVCIFEVICKFLPSLEAS